MFIYNYFLNIIWFLILKKSKILNDQLTTYPYITGLVFFLNQLRSNHPPFGPMPGPCPRPLKPVWNKTNNHLIYRTVRVWLYRIFFKADIQNPVSKTKKPSARTLKFLKIFGSMNVRTSRFPFVRSKVYSSLFTRTETKINDIWFGFPRNDPPSLKDILKFASASTF